ncbi:LysR family transcriptional regulator [Bradyrhizobium nanningense]|uniref:LysR family transcriptional regulator n=1 Tax=Bradyrhizobium nanningense TaxID=1325118 RepID=A0A4Q0RYF2_9BRAD|nr:LysR family transcriptional regulator [Bradyrhizobium nanningense]RXH24147.1 LysR family transcriptional regulator [Bradyrhizobium nanningense]RXH29296.1 LysR family transcriptional regulator [Bradyrhizobium nanningense]
MELHQVRYFLAVANTLNFTRAAEMCNVTQPALTKGVQKLEQELGGQLIYRERQLTHLTDLGKAVFPMLERALASTEGVRRRAREFRQKKVAPLTIGLAPSISASLVLEPIAEIRKVVQGLNVELREESPSRLVELLLEGVVNLALVGDLEDKPDRIDDWALFEERYVAVLSPSHELAGLPVIGMKALREAIILDRLDCDVAPKVHRLCFPDALPHYNHRSSRDLHLQHLAAAGFGIVLAPEHMPRLPSLKALPIEGDPVWREVRLLAVQGRRYSPALDAFVKVARLRDWSLPAGSPLQTEQRGHLEASGMVARLASPIS